MRLKILAIATIAVASMALTRTPVQGDTYVGFDLNAADLVYTVATKNLVVSESLGSDFIVRHENEDLTPQIRDTAKILGGADFDFLLDLTLVDGTPNDGKWTATGQMKFTDTATGTWAGIGDFTSTSITWDALGGPGFFQVVGVLSTPTGQDAILINRGDPWVFAGETNVVGKLDDDGSEPAAYTITIPNRPSYDAGTVFTFKFGVSASSLDNLLSTNQTLDGGEVKGTITPVPGAIVLGAIGLALVGLKMRKLA